MKRGERAINNKVIEECRSRRQSKFTIRVDSELLKKFRFIAEYNARSANKEIEVLMKEHVAEFEKVHGKIEPEYHRQ